MGRLSWFGLFVLVFVADVDDDVAVDTAVDGVAAACLLFQLCSSRGLAAPNMLLLLLLPPGTLPAASLPAVSAGRSPSTGLDRGFSFSTGRCEEDADNGASFDVVDMLL